MLVDVREAADFEGAYLAGAINIGLKGKYATWAGSMLSHDTPVVVIGDGENEEEAVMRLGRIGFDNVAGYLQDGMHSLEAHPEHIRKVARITAVALAEQTSSSDSPFVLDVRAEKEAGIVRLEGSYNIPLTHLRERISEVPQDRPVVVHCEGGYRSAIAFSVLAQAGRTNVTDLVGGIKAWIATKLPTQPEDSAAVQSLVCIPIETSSQQPVGYANDGPNCQRDAAGQLILTSRCARLLLLVGVASGILSGMFGVGGGFIIVPALILFSSMSMSRAVGTSLMVISLVSASGVAFQLWDGQTIAKDIAVLFVVGGLCGLWLGQSVSHRLSPSVLQQVFSAAILLVAVFVILRNVS